MDNNNMGKFISRQLSTNPIRFIVVCALAIAAGWLFDDILNQVGVYNWIKK